MEDSKWYYPYSKTVEITSITVSGDAHLILSKGHTLTVKKGIYVKDGSSLTIYGQPNGDGTLVTTGEDGYAGIGGFNGAAHNAPIAITIHGGNITATGGTGAAGIGVSGGSGINNSITIYGGTITATGGRNGAGIGNNISTVCTTITIYGGEITAAGGTNGAGIGGGTNKGSLSTSCGTVNIYGGNITATGSRYEHISGCNDLAEYYPAGIGGGNRFDCTVNIYGGNITAKNYRDSTSDYENGYGIRGQITLSYKNANDLLYATNYGGTVTVADGKSFIVDGTEISGTVEVVKVEKALSQTETAIIDTCPALDGKTLIPPSYNVNVGTNRITASTAKAFSGETVTVSPAEGYNLTSVKVNGTAITGNTFTMPANDVTVTATTSLITYTITYDLDGGTVSTANPATYTIETATFTLNNPTKTGYTFAGWSSFAGGVRVVNYTIKQGSTGDKTLIANWTLNQYTLTFDTQGGSEISAITQDYGSAITAPGNPTKTGCTFAGWSPEIPATMPAENLTVKALWTLNQYTLTFDTQGGSEISAITQDYGSTITPPDNPTKTGYTFGGWYTDSDCANAYDFASVVTGNLTLYAKWTAITYSITYNLDGGSLPEGTSNPETYTIETESFTLTNPTKDGYTFLGWTLDGSNDDPAITVTVRTGTTGNLAYTTNWQKNAFSPKDSETPEFAYHSLILSGQIGVIFHVYAPEGLASKDFCVYFDVSGDKSQNTQPVYAFETMTEDGKNFLGFKCYINSIQMADKIHAELHYKDTNASEQTITHDYTAKQYLTRIIDDTTQADDTRELGRAIMDFGSYVQPVLAKENGWSIDIHHAKMTPANDYNDTDFTAADTATQTHALTNTLTDSSGIDEVKFALMLDSETTIILCLIPKSDYTGEVSAYVDSNKTDNMAVKDGDIYTVSIGNISAHELGEKHNIEITTQYPNAASNTFNVNISALSYVYSAIQQDDTDMKRAVTSLYRYYDSTMTYRKNRPEIYGTN